jgi:hypothetical protein
MDADSVKMLSKDVLPVIVSLLWLLVVYADKIRQSL